MTLTLLPITGVGEVREGDEIATLLFDAAAAAGRRSRRATAWW